MGIANILEKIKNKEPLGISLALKMIPRPVITACRDKAEARKKQGKPTNWVTGALFILIWVLIAVWIGSFCYKLLT